MPRYDTDAPTEVEITIDIGSVHVITGAGDHASVTVNPSDADRDLDVRLADRTEVELDDGHLVVRAVEAHRFAKLIGPGQRTGSVDLVVEVPDGIDLTVSGQVVSVRVDGSLGVTEIRTQMGDLALDHTENVVARTSGGDVTIGHVTGRARVQGAGTIHLGALTGPAEVKNLTGPIEVGTAGSSLRLRSSTGDLTVTAATADVVARTSHGAITIGAVEAGVLDLRTAAGTIRVGVPEATSVLVDATTKLGRVEQRLTAIDGPAPTDRRAEIRAHTSMGDVVIHRA